MPMDDATRRTLRFSVFLQAAAAVMFGVAFVVWVTTTGWDVLTVVFGALALAAAAAAAFTLSRLRARP